MTWENSGALGGTRTPNLLIRSQMLYPLSYERGCGGQSTARGVNPVPSRVEPSYGSNEGGLA
jgi:hypothetical protein